MRDGRRRWCAVERTWRPLLGVLLVAFLAGWSLQRHCPEAVLLSKAIACPVARLDILTGGMKRLLLVALLAAGLMLAEKSKTEITRPSSPDDAKPNSDQVPGAMAVSGQFERIVVFRFKYQSDLLAGMEKLVKEQKIKNAVFLSGIGSLRNYHFHGVSNRTFPSKNVFVKDTTAPSDIVSINGFVIDGKVHAHMTLADDEKAFGGHIEAGNQVFTFAVVTLGVFSAGMDLSRFDDKTYR